MQVRESRSHKTICDLEGPRVMRFLGRGIEKRCCGHMGFRYGGVHPSRLAKLVLTTVEWKKSNGPGEHKMFVLNLSA